MFSSSSSSFPFTEALPDPVAATGAEDGGCSAVFTVGSHRGEASNVKEVNYVMHYSRREFNVPKHIIKHVRSGHQSKMLLMLILFCVELQLLKGKFYRMSSNDTPIVPSGGSSTHEDHHFLGKRSREVEEEEVESAAREVAPYRNFECTDCHASFEMSRDLMAHMTSCHPENANWRVNNPQSPLRLPAMASVVGSSAGVANGDQVVDASEDVWDVKEKFGLTKKCTEKGKKDDHVLEAVALPPPPPPPVDQVLEVQAPPPPVVGRGVDVDLNLPPPEDCEMTDLALEAEAPPPLVDPVLEVQAPPPPVGGGVDVDLNFPPPEDY